MNDLANSSNSLEPIDENQIKQFQALYYLIKGKRDTDIKLFDDYKQFTYSDLTELNDKIYKKLSTRQLVTDIVNVSVGFENREIRTFGNWLEFTKTDWNISALTKYISLEWDFNLVLPNIQVPQAHSLRIRIGNNLKPSEMIQVVFQGADEYELEEVQSQMVCKIDFVNSEICSELKLAVSEWYDALPKNSADHKSIRFVLKNEVKIQNFIVLSFLASSVILCNYLYAFFLNNRYEFIPTDLNQRLFFLLTSSIPIIYISYRSGVLFADRIIKRVISKLRRNPMFEFTKGDKNKFTEIQIKNKKLLRQLIINIFFALSSNLVTYLIGVLLMLKG